VEKEEKREEIRKRGRGKLTISLGSIRRTLEMEVLHHVP